MTSPARALRRAAQGFLSLSGGAAVAAVLLPAAATASPLQAAAAQAPAPQPQQTAPSETTAPQTPPVPGAPPPPAVVVPGVPVATPAPVGRTFAAPVGLLFNTVRTERVKDFEIFLAYLRAALEKATDPGIQAQARGWRMLRATEPGPNSTVLYVFVLDPTVTGADYSLGHILADAYPDPVQLSEIWKLYTSSVVGGGSLLNLTPLKPTLPPAPGAPGAVPPGDPVAPAAPAPVNPPAR